MTDEELESMATRLVDNITGDTPEGIVAGLAQLCAMKGDFKLPFMYYALMKTMADVLSIKCDLHAKEPHQ